jgi:hypothetical protein
LADPLVMPPMTGVLLNAVPAHWAGIAGGVFNTSRQIGGALAVAVFGALLAGRAGFLPGLRTSLLLAAAVALVAVGGVARTVVGLLLTAAGAALAWSGVRVLAGGLDAAGADLPGISGGSVRVDVVAAWPVLALIAGLAGLLAGLFVVVRGRSWPGLGRRYERGPAAAPRSDADRAQAAWTALDRGEDPTA